MSYSELFGVFPGEDRDAVSLLELKNGHGTAPVVWNEMSQRWLGWEEHQYFMHGIEGMDPLWQLYQHLGIPAAHRAVLVFTFDRAYVEKQHYDRFARDVECFNDSRMHYTNPHWVNHWPKVAELFASEPEYPAIGLYATSVGDCLWTAAYDEDDNRLPFDWTGYYSAYGLIDNLCKEEE
jgi:hypothetical protein